jgi:hypothetical protein
MPVQKISLILDEETAHWAQDPAAGRNTTLSTLFGEILAERMRQDTDSEAAKKRFSSKTPQQLREGKSLRCNRDSLHDCDDRH